MAINQNKIRLAPRLRWGVGRDKYNLNFFKIGGGIFLAISAVLVVRASLLLFSGGETTRENPQVLGAQDTVDSKQSFTEYKVKKGDTLFTISKESGVEWTALATLNNLEPPFALQVNDTLRIPKK